jgi:4-hydroxy-tetrahydrodipicolinate synthase
MASGLATTMKAGLERLGIDVGDPRRPLLPLDDEGRAALKELLSDARPQHRARHRFRRLLA